MGFAKFIKMLGVSAIITLYFTIIIFLLERFGVIMIYVEYLSTRLFDGEAALFLFLVLFGTDFLWELTKWGFNYREV